MKTLLTIEEPELEDEPIAPIAVGIDFGTTHSVVALKDGPDKPPYILPLNEGRPLIPSVVTYKKGKKSIGEENKGEDSGFSVRSVKRMLTSANHFYDYTKQKGGNLTPEDVALDLMVYLKEKTESYLERSIQKVVLTVPAYFDERARSKVYNIAHEAGFSILRLLHEPTAAALAYGLEKKLQGIYGVYDLGGGTFDFSLLRLTEGVFQVIGTTGIVDLGGDDFDNLLANDLIQRGFVPSFLDNKKEMEQLVKTSPDLIRYARSLKEKLSEYESVPIYDSLFNEDLLGKVDRATYEALIAPLVDMSLKRVEEALKEADVPQDTLEGIILVGGASRTPLIHKRLKEIYGDILLSYINPEEAVAIGAAYHAWTLSQGQGTLLLDVTPLSLGIETMGGGVEPIIFRNSPLPCEKTCLYTTVHPDQEEILIHVLQGDGNQVKDCLSLGQFILKTPRVSEEPRRIEVTFRLDVNGLLSVEGRDIHSGLKEMISLFPKRSLENDVQSQMP